MVTGLHLSTIPEKAKWTIGLTSQCFTKASSAFVTWYVFSLKNVEKKLASQHTAWSWHYAHLATRFMCRKFVSFLTWLWNLVKSLPYEGELTQTQSLGNWMRLKHADVKRHHVTGWASLVGTALAIYIFWQAFLFPRPTGALKVRTGRHTSSSLSAGPGDDPLS